MKGKPTIISLVLASFLLSPALSAPTFAAGRTYVPQNQDDEPKVKYETCRLKKAIREDGKTLCVYKRQSRGNDVVITVDSVAIQCQSQFTCKRER